MNNFQVKAPQNIEFIYDLTTDSYTNYILDDSFLIFTSIDKTLFLIYLTSNNTIVIYDLDNKQKIGEIKQHHTNYISTLRHFLDNKNKTDLIMSISCQDNNLIIWDLNNLKCILNIIKVNEGGILHSACFLNEKDNNFILTSNSAQTPFYINFEPIKIFDFDGQKIGEIKDSKDKTFFMDVYYDTELNKNFVITCNFNYLKSYDYEKNEIYHKYYEKDDGAHYTFSIHNIEKVIKLIETSNSGVVRIWNFHTGELLNKICINNKRIFGICLWDNDNLFVGCDDKNIRLIEFKTGEVIKTFEGHNDIILTLKKINHQKLGKCLISKGFKEDQIKLWGFKK